MTGFTVPSLSDMYCACYQKITTARSWSETCTGWSKTEHSFYEPNLSMFSENFQILADKFQPKHCIIAPFQSNKLPSVELCICVREQFIKHLA